MYCYSTIGSQHSSYILLHLNMMAGDGAKSFENQSLMPSSCRAWCLHKGLRIRDHDRDTSQCLFIKPSKISRPQKNEIKPPFCNTSSFFLLIRVSFSASWLVAAEHSHYRLLICSCRYSHLYHNRDRLSTYSPSFTYSASWLSNKVYTEATKCFMFQWSITPTGGVRLWTM